METKEMGRGQAYNLDWAMNIEQVVERFGDHWTGQHGAAPTSSDLCCSTLHLFLFSTHFLGVAFQLHVTSVGSQYPFNKLPSALTGDRVWLRYLQPFTLTNVSNEIDTLICPFYR